MFAAVGYAMPIIGGIIADRLAGFRAMVIIGGSIMVLGHALMALVALDPDLIFYGLGFIAIGTGFFKGNITNLLGSCYREGDQERARGFSLFYVSVNVGSFLASISCGYVAHIFGWHYGFGLAGVGMAIGLLTFISYQKVLGGHGLSPKPKLFDEKVFGLSVIGALALGLAVSSLLRTDGKFFIEMMKYLGAPVGLGYLFAIFFKSTKSEAKHLVALFILIVFFTFFFALEMQLGSLINLFSQRNVDKVVLGYEVPASVSQAINPISIVVLGAFFARFIKFNKKYDLIRFALGLSTMAFCFSVLYMGCISAGETAEVSYIYLVIGISFMGLGELLVAPFIQEQASLLAPNGLKGFVMGVVMFALSLANIAGIIISKFLSVPSVDGEVNKLESLNIYREGFLSVIQFCVLSTFIFVLLIPLLKRLRKA